MFQFSCSLTFLGIHGIIFHTFFESVDYKNTKIGKYASKLYLKLDLKIILNETRQVYNGPWVAKLITAIRTRQVYYGPRVVKFISAKRQKNVGLK